ncbi:hypothetical protein [Leptolyngbya iicbica]|uniref:Uncharacterized protein n=2 Tax=Cyanophyceae TaxID=3028117 RepID=A0A4Q7E246_9CYAN|nr:hypothetical protein [Leptolyngbya sp. LK]RZM75640.1 hypothetical protein DYY88_20265 [Leptolyngbya sp. LK]
MQIPPPPPPTYPPPPPPPPRPTYPPPPPPILFGPEPPRPPNPEAVVLTLACDLMFLSVTIGIGILLQILVATVWPPTISAVERDMMEWMPFWAVVTTSLGYLMLDGWRCWRRRSQLPFQAEAKAIYLIYWQRFELVIDAIAAHLLLLCLCLLLPYHPFFSKLFMAAALALLAFVLGRGMPTRQLAFVASTGVFTVAMLVIAIAVTVSA